ncbi:MAG: acyloxyacyl hydrolase [Desulfovibrionaceae bacterium]|nr:acyloxyacyl hydrolase [Desulfovibrionaceae bacterium]
MKRVIAIAVFALMLTLPGLASAQGSGMYLAPKFLMSIQDTGNMSRSQGGMGVDDYSQFTLGGALALGYDLWPQQMIPLRMELELAMRGNSETSWDGPRGSVKGTWNNTTLFANLYWDFHNDSQMTPYVGGGLGMAFNYAGYDIHDNTHNNHFSMDEHSTNFAWNLGAGVAYQFNESLSLDAAYRFVGLGYNEVKSTVGGREYKISNNPYNNEFMLGLRFSF